jgi:hypothetical protein
MNSRLALLISLAGSAACAGGSTMRVAQEDAPDDTPVSLAPAPEGTADSAVGSPTSSPPQSSIQDTARSEQGYTPYGNETSVQIRRIGQWTHTGIREARRTVIQDANAWAEFWSELGVGDRPAIDFTRSVVIAVAAGERPTGGHEIAVTKVTRREGELTVQVLETTPGPNCISATALSQPADVVVIEGDKPKSWSFVEQKEVRSCRP